MYYSLAQILTPTHTAYDIYITLFNTQHLYLPVVLVSQLIYSVFKLELVYLLQLLLHRRMDVGIMYIAEKPITVTKFNRAHTYRWKLTNNKIKHYKGS